MYIQSTRAQHRSSVRTREVALYTLNLPSVKAAADIFHKFPSDSSIRLQSKHCCLVLTDKHNKYNAAGLFSINLGQV